MGECNDLNHQQQSKLLQNLITYLNYYKEHKQGHSNINNRSNERK